ncbi:MAG TPA: AAA family ATPase [Mycobacteriales bacterium]|nr:AAA family ATPase [Mycobacteriales bacterium]
MSDSTRGSAVPRTLTASVLFVDVVGSTALRSEVGEEQADVLSRNLEAQIGQVIGDHRGRVVKGLGDGVLAVFESAVDAVGAGVAVQQAAELQRRLGGAGAVELRVGVSAGDVSFDSSDVLGAPVVEASRLCGSAQPGQVLVADLVRSLSRGRGSFVFESVGDLALRGLPEPVPACQVMWDPLPADGEAASSGLPFPGLLASGGGTSYVGREAALAMLTARLDAVLAGTAHLSTVLLSGEPGIGKTRTAAELARRAHSAGAVVLYGCCDEELGVPFQPFVEALDFYSAHEESPRLGRLAGELTRLCPELSARVQGLPAPVTSDPRTEEYRLFEAVTSWLTESSRETGVCMVLDDLHWATRSTLNLLVHLLRAAAATPPARLMIVGTYRDTELDRMHPLTSVLADLRRIEGVERLDLQGLSLGETVALVETVAGHQLDDDGRRLAEVAFAETEGNPLFMGEMLRHFVETATVALVDGRWQVNELGPIAIPEGVRDVIGRRLGRLSESANRMLSVAAVIGRDFDLELLSYVSDVDDNALLDALDESCRARVVEEIGPEQFRFFHAVVKEALYGELSTARRRRLHRTVLEALEKLRPDDAVALAYHAIEAGPAAGDMGAAVTHLLEAATQASGSRDLAGAESYYRRAVELIDAGQPDPVRRIEAVCGLGEAQRDQADPAYRTTLLEATHAALTLGRADLAASAAIANFRGVTSAVNQVDVERVAALRLTLASLEGERTADTALLAATLVAEINYDLNVAIEERVALTDQAIEIARESGSPKVIAEVILRTGRVHLLPDRAEQGWALVSEAMALADETGDPAQRVLSRVFANASSCGLGDFKRAEQLITEGIEIASRDCAPFFLALSEANALQHAIYRGQLDDATQANDDLLGVYQQLGVTDGEQWWAAIAMSIAFHRGALSDLADPAAEFAERYPTAVAWRGTQAWTLVEAGRHREAREVVARYRLDQPEQFPIDEFILSSWGYVSLLAFLLDDVGLGAKAERLLRPYEHLWISIQIYSMGPVAWMIALSLAAQRRYDEAEDAFEGTDQLLAERGLAVHRPALGYYRALSLSRSPSIQHIERARTLAQRGVEDSIRSGAPRLSQRFQALLDALP